MVRKLINWEKYDMNLTDNTGMTCCFCEALRRMVRKGGWIDLAIFGLRDLVVQKDKTSNGMFSYPNKEKAS